MTSEHEENAFLDFYEGQFQWYDSKALRNKRLYYLLKGLALVLAASLPVIATLNVASTSASLRYLIYITSIGLVITESMESLLDCHENWISYRTTAESLRREREAYRTGVGPYNSKDAKFRIFADRVLDLVSEEHRYWRTVTSDETSSWGNDP